MTGRKPKTSMLNFSGFTMVELLVSVGVMGSLLAIAVPSFIALRPARQLNGATREVLGQLFWARARAVEENNQYVVSFPTNHSLVAAGGQTLARDLQDDYPGVTLSKGAGDPDPTFTPRGTTGGTTTITLTNSSGSRTLTVSITGVITIS